MKTSIILISLAVLILFIITIFTARVYTSALRLSHPINRSILGVTFLIPLMFLASIITSRSVSWGIGPFWYTFINSLAGVFFYVFLGAIILVIAFVTALIIGKILPTAVPWSILILSLLLGLTGLVQSRFIKTTHYTVTLSNAPAEWNDKKAVLVSDTHFGLVNHQKFSDKVVKKILSVNPDFVLHAGDFYDGPKIKTDGITTSWQKLTAVIPVFYTPGNHELYGDYNAFISSIKSAGITVLDDKKVEYEGVQIGGIGYQSGSNSEMATKNIESLSLNPSLASILINHPPTSLVSANKAGIDLMVSGHTHNGQFWPNTYVVRKIYGEQAYGLNLYNKMHTITTSGVGTFGPPLRLFNRPEIVVITFKTQ